MFKITVQFVSIKIFEEFFLHTYALRMLCSSRFITKMLRLLLKGSLENFGSETRRPLEFSYKSTSTTSRSGPDPSG